RYRACPLLKQLVTAGRLGDKSGRGVFEYSK
ncbi:MAG: 3-hydroxybutyryl-CoA dehydrogenase, partial [Phycisphaerales bacterium]|nr:3-hydroxybutyryl-CoA dehydrogenase [Phycisphaerales bacterium]